MSRQSAIGSGQIVGERERQEDAVGVTQFRRLGNALAMVLADGMGGHAGGDVAAKLATRTVLAYLKAGTALPSTRLKPALQAANDGIRRAVQTNTALDGMGCTLVAVTISSDRLRWISVGDSVLFLLRGGQLVRLNADHSMRTVFAEMVARGRLSEEEAARDPTRNALRSAVTGDEIELIDAPDKDLLLHDRDLILLVSDGVETLTDEEIAQTASRAMARGGQSVVDALLKAVAVRNAQHQDNASAIAYIHSTGRGASIAPRSAATGQRMLLAVVATATLVLASWTAWIVWPSHPTHTYASGGGPSPKQRSSDTKLPGARDLKRSIPSPKPSTLPITPPPASSNNAVGRGMTARAPGPNAATAAEPAIPAVRPKPRPAATEQDRSSHDSQGRHPGKPQQENDEVPHAADHH